MLLSPLTIKLTAVTAALTAAAVVRARGWEPSRVADRGRGRRLARAAVQEGRQMSAPTQNAPPGATQPRHRGPDRKPRRRAAELRMPLPLVSPTGARDPPGSGGFTCTRGARHCRARAVVLIADLGALAAALAAPGTCRLASVRRRISHASVGLALASAR